MSFVIHCGDALEVLRKMESESVHCCVTSPPYWGLRDYGTAVWEGSSSDCDHRNQHGRQGKTGDRATRTFTGSQDLYRQTCQRCNAVRVDQQLGLENSPEEYINRAVEIFRELRRVLRDDGTLWLNLGDSYNARPNQRKQGVERNDVAGWKQATNTGCLTIGSRNVATLKPKDLVGIPWMLAFALRADGWWLRSEIIWAKPNPMPESVTDRPTKAHEQIFLLSKSEHYSYDADAVREVSESRDPRVSRSSRTFAGRVQRNSDLERYGTTRGRTNQPCCNPSGRNKRSVWTVPTQPTPEAHFATYPIALIEPCILAGCPEGGTVIDPFCGAGTTGMGAVKHGRNFVGIELNPKYVEIARSRLLKKMPLLAQEFIQSANAEPEQATNER